MAKNKKYRWFRFQFVKLFLIWLISEFLFRAIAFKNFFSTSLLLITLFTLATTLFLTAASSLLPKKHANRFMGFFNWFLPVYCLVQLQFKNYMNNFESVKAAKVGVGNLFSYVLDFIIHMKPIFFLLLIAPILGTVFSRHVYLKKGRRRVPGLIWLVAALIVGQIGYACVNATGNINAYKKPTAPDKTMNTFGAARYFLMDIGSLFKGKDNTLLEVSKATATPDSSAAPTATPVPVPHRWDHFDDTTWKNLEQQETNENVKMIDNYLMNRDITDYNDHTGMFKDYNVIYVMIEAFDWMAIDPVVCPTMYKMMTEGWNFSHHYTPVFSCQTIESEMISEFDLVPMADGCTSWVYPNNDWASSIFNQFRHKGYYTSSYHNWWDQWYQRRVMYQNSGGEDYKNKDDLNLSPVTGWPSDDELFQQTTDYWINKDKFFSTYVTVTTHFPYTNDTYYGDKYLDIVQQAHPDMPINLQRYMSKAVELDHGFATLLSRLEEAGKLDNTLIVVYGDHHPLDTDLDLIRQWGSTYCSREGMDIDRQPFFMYNPNMTPTEFTMLNSTFDILPTVLNLTGMDYDPRLYMGTDLFSDKPATVIFPNGDFINQDGYYEVSSGETNLSQEEINNVSAEISNMFTISQMIYDTNYWQYRHDIVWQDGTGTPEESSGSHTQSTPTPDASIPPSATPESETDTQQSQESGQ